MSQQLCLFKFERPLVDRFGLAFFRAVPRVPGVYIFFGARGRVLYVGQSKNLRLRLAYYKNARPEREPRKIIRLVHQTRRIEVRACDTPEAAQLREAELIRARKPKFNTALASSRAYSFFAVTPCAGSLRLRISMREEPREGEALFGAFKNRGLCRRAFFAAGRVLWSENHKPATVFDFPLWLHQTARIAEWELKLSDEKAESDLREMVSGSSSEFINRLERLATNCTEPFLKRHFESDWLTLAEFWALAQRMKELRAFAGREILPQGEVDGCSLRQRFATISESGLRVVPQSPHFPELYSDPKD